MNAARIVPSSIIPVNLVHLLVTRSRYYLWKVVGGEIQKHCKNKF